MKNSLNAVDLITEGDTPIGGLKLAELTKYALLKLSKIAVSTGTELKISMDIDHNGNKYKVFLKVDYEYLNPKPNAIIRFFQLLHYVKQLCKNGKEQSKIKPCVICGKINPCSDCNKAF